MSALTLDSLLEISRKIRDIPPQPRFVESWDMVDRVEDWSRVRSPSRARRRLKYGYPQNITIRHVPKKDAISFDGGKTYYVHPQMMDALRKATNP